MGDVIQLDTVYPGEDDEQEARRRALEAMRAQIAADTPEALDAEEPGIRAEAMAGMPPPPPEAPREPVRLPEQVIAPPPRSPAPPPAIAAMGDALRARRAPAAEPAEPPAPPAPAPKTGGTPSDRDWEAKAAKAAQGEWEQAQSLTNDNRRRKAIIAALGAVLGASPASVQAALQGGDEPMQLLMAKRRDDAERRSARSAQERSQQDRAENARRASLDERRVSLAESEAARRGERDDAQAERLGRLDESRIQLETIRADAARGTAEAQAQMRDPQSAASQAARDLVTQQASNPRLGLNVDPEQLAGMSAQQIEEVYGLGNLGTGWQNVRRGVGRAGRGGAGGPNVRSTRQRAAMVSDLRRAGYSDEQIAGQLEQMGIEAPEGQMDPYRMSEAVGRMQRAGYTQEEIRQELGAAAPAGGVELLPGVRAGIDVGNSEPEKFRTAFADMRAQYAALDRMQALSSRFGANAIVSPQARAEISAELPALRAMVAQLQNSGIINPGEAPLINATLPNPSDLQQMTFGEVGIRSNSFKRQLEASVRAGLETRGVDEAGITRAMAGLRGRGFSGGGAAPTGGRPSARRTQGATITVRSPNGTTRDVPRGWYEHLDERRRNALQVVE